MRTNFRLAPTPGAGGLWSRRSALLGVGQDGQPVSRADVPEAPCIAFGQQGTNVQLAVPGSDRPAHPADPPLRVRRPPSGHGLDGTSLGPDAGPHAHANLGDLTSNLKGTAGEARLPSHGTTY